MMSVPTATCTVTGMSSAAAVASRLNAATCGGLSLQQVRPAAWPRPSPCLTPSLMARFSSAPVSWPCRTDRARARVDVFRGRARQRNLEVVNESGAVGRERGDEAAAHQVGHDRRQPGLHDMGADAPHDRPLAPPGLEHAPRPPRGNPLRPAGAANGRRTPPCRHRGGAGGQSRSRSPCSTAIAADRCGHARDRTLRMAAHGGGRCGGVARISSYTEPEPEPRATDSIASP